jgi:hypothetical protein
MHRQLAEILRPYVRTLDRISGPLFPAMRSKAKGAAGGGLKPITDWREVLDAVAERAGFTPGSVRSRRFRVSYATHRCTCEGISVNGVRHEGG